VPVAVRNISAPPGGLLGQTVANQAHAELSLEEIDVPRVTVSDDVRHTAAGVDQPPQLRQETHRGLRHQVAVLDILVEHVSHEHERAAGEFIAVGIEQRVEVGLGRPALCRRAAPDVEIGDEESQWNRVIERLSD
jgi:hypothetical protein